jgi:eukaryotic-like serine/threonine-protein kinase
VTSALWTAYAPRRYPDDGGPAVTMDDEVPGYQLHQRIGVGAASEVYRAEPVGSPGRPVAVKRLRIDVAPRAVEELRREAMALARLSHPSLMRILDVVPDGAGVALVLPLAVGGSLADRLATADGGLEPAEAADLGARLASALAAVHDAGLVHRDVKPGNILFDAEGQPLLGELGTARLTSERAPVAGTAEYLDPAVVHGAVPDARTDVYGLGVTLYEILAGVPPFAGSTPRQTLAAADRSIHVPLAEVSQAPAALVATIERAMARDPSDRFPTASELAGLLDESRRRLETGGATHDLPPQPATGRAGVLGAVPRPSALPRAVPTAPGTSARAATPEGEGLEAAEPSDTRADRPARPRSPDPRPTPDRIDRRLLGTAALLVLLVPLGIVWWLVRGDEVDLTLDARSASGEEDAAPPEEASSPEVTPRPAPSDVDTSLPPCDHAGHPDAPDAARILQADIEGRGCTVPVAWDGRQLTVPLRSGGTARYELDARSDDVLLLGDWNCDGRATPALYRPGDGQLFVFDEFDEDTTARGISSGVQGGRPVVVRGDDRCDRIDIEPAS